MQVLLLRTAVYSAKNSSHSKATKINQKFGQVTILTPLPFPVQMIQKSGAVVIQIKNTLWQQGKIVATALYGFISGAQENFWHRQCMLYFTLTQCDPIMCREKKYNFQCAIHVCFQCYLVLYAESMQPLKKLKRESLSFT